MTALPALTIVTLMGLFRGALAATAAAAAAAANPAACPKGDVAAHAEDCPGEDDENCLLQVALDMTARRNQSRAPSSPSSRGTYWQILKNYDDLQYTGTITAGAQNLSAVMDTGSFEILVFSKDCYTCGQAGGANGYNHHSSTTYSTGTLVKTHVYGSGSAMSFDGVEHFAVGPYAVRNQDFWEAMDAQMPVLVSATFQAIVGLGPPGEPQIGARQMLDRARKVLKMSTTLPIERQRAEQDIQIAELILGKNDSLLMNTNMQYISACFEWASNAPGYVVWNDTPPQQQSVLFMMIPVISKIHWSVNITMARFDGPEGVIDLGCAGGCEAVMDTGTSLIAVPSPVFTKALNELNGLDASCANMHKMPDLVFSLGGQRYSLPPQSYIGVIRGSEPKDPQGWWHNKTSARACQLLLLDAGFGTSNLGPMWIIGMPFFRYYYTTFDLGSDPYNPASRKIWTAPAAADCTPASQASHSLKISHARSQPLWSINGSRIRLPRMRKRRSSPSAVLAAPTGPDDGLAAEEMLAWRQQTSVPREQLRD
mmetsp:Transcript_20/g.51  ORF Transcript_20/g.51 Transcript_20/m.51 type:complete len:539 (-) Transcript_20:155-1771(-)